MKKHILFWVGILIYFNSFASHIIGGDMRYQFLKLGSAPNTKTYQISLRLFRDIDCIAPCAAMPTDVFIGIFNNDNNAEYPTSAPFDVFLNTLNVVPVNAFPPCITNPPLLNYEVGEYTFTVDLPDNQKGYTATYQTCCRVVPIDNIVNFRPALTGSTYSCNIPGNTILNGRTNTSANFNTQLSVICQNKPFVFNFDAIDSDKDSLVYRFDFAFNGGRTTNSANVNPDPPSYASVTYIAPYTFDHPLGSQATIDPSTGKISGIAPPSGRYVVCVRVDEYRNGDFIGYATKDFIINVASCDFAGVQLDPKPVTCDGYTVNFINGNNSPLNLTYDWNFGDPKYPNNTSNQANPTHIYTDTGVYVFKLVVNKGQPCADSATQIVKVYPGFSPGFTISSPCINTSIKFTDTTKTKWGFVDSWNWDFGDLSNPINTSKTQNPNFTYTKTGTYNVTLNVTNSKGCSSKVVVPLTIINQPVVTVSFTDTSYCGKDTIQLSAKADVAANFSWTPLYNIINPNTANPLVFPANTTKYTVTADAGGCSGNASVTVRPVNDLKTTVSANANSICEEDTVTLSASSNHSPINYNWTPNYNLKNNNSPNVMAYPKVDTTYTVTGTWGNGCTSSSSIRIRVKALAKPVAGPDQSFCQGGAGVQLNASGGDDYVWSPSSGLNNSNIPNPFANPSSTTKYIVSVGVTGCDKKRTDSLIVNVLAPPVLTKTNDTLICSIDTLQLNASSPSAGKYNWSPNYNIINPNTSSPQVFPKTTTKYYVSLTDNFGCSNSDSVLVNVKQFVTIKAPADSGICSGDTIQLNPTSDALHFKWSPSGPLLSSDTAKSPLAKPSSTTRFYVIANIGKCQSSDSVLIKVSPLPIASPRIDTSVCFGVPVQLNATGGSKYLWTPPFFLSDPNISNPVATPDRNIRYRVQINDTLGCPKAVFDTVFIKVYPKINANAGPDDTSIVINQPLQLLGSGGVSYLWSPPTGLNSTTIPNPIATVSSDITYLLQVGNGNGCFAFDSIRVRVYNVVPSLFVPNAFTPNKDGRNDVFRPVAVGIKKINYFRVYNRWGNLVFSTTEVNKGWDGTYKGKPQDAAVFVWIVQGIDFNDKVITQKGTMVLIR